MKLAIPALAALVLIGLTAGGEAAQKAQKKKYVKRHAPAAASQWDGTSATARQKANSRAFERGDYYEALSDQHVFGSRSWWMLKEREMGGGNFQ